MKSTLTFDLPEEYKPYYMATHAGEYWQVLSDLRDYLFETDNKEVAGELHRLLTEQGVTIDV